MQLLMCHMSVSKNDESQVHAFCTP